MSIGAQSHVSSSEPWESKDALFESVTYVIVNTFEINIERNE